MANTLQHPPGMPDRFEEELVAWRHLEQLARQTFLAFGFGEIRTPLVEETALFVRGVGESSDIVSKEMFGVVDRMNTTALSLRPENTAGVVRALIQGGKVFADAYSKVFYVGPQFRNERPQAGRFKQLHQVGCESLGYSEAAADVEVIALVQTLLTRLGITDVKLHLNSLGDAADRPAYRDALVGHFSPLRAKLSLDSQARLETNPLRILDSKDEQDRVLSAGAPKPAEFMNPAARAHFEAVQRGLTELGVPFVLDDKLVRGLDYYTRTVFEFIGDKGLGAQSAVAAGGRYDNLVEELGGRSTPAVGFAAGVERLLMSMIGHGVTVSPHTPALMIVGADDAGRVQAASLAHGLRQRGVAVDVDLRGRSVKAQMRHADKAGARFTLVLGSREIADGRAELKPMAGGDVRVVAPSVETLAAELSAARSEGG